MTPKGHFEINWPLSNAAWWNVEHDCEDWCACGIAAVLHLLLSIYTSYIQQCTLQYRRKVQKYMGTSRILLVEEGFASIMARNWVGAKASPLALPDSTVSTSFRINAKVALWEAGALSCSFESIDCEISWKSSTVTICYFFCRKNKAFHHMIWMTQDNMKCRKITSIIKIGKRFEDNRWQLCIVCTLTCQIIVQCSKSYCFLGK
jgi:hypothetical protein